MRSLILLSLLFFISCASALKCGLVIGEISTDGTQISASWSNLLETTATYEWAIVSQRMLSTPIKEGECKSSPFMINPDIRGWESVVGQQAQSNKLVLVPGLSYYVVVRATTSTGVFYASSAAIAPARHLLARNVRDLDARDDDSSSNMRSSDLVGSPTNRGDDDDLEDWEIGLIAMGCAICCLLIIAAVLLGVFKGKGEDKYQTNVHRNENVEKI